MGTINHAVGIRGLPPGSREWEMGSGEGNWELRGGRDHPVGPECISIAETVTWPLEWLTISKTKEKKRGLRVGRREKGGEAT